MKAIILAAGEGKRMGLETKSKPKCMIDYNGKYLIDHTIFKMESLGIKDIIIVNGYKGNIIENHISNPQIKFYKNNEYDSTNMVYSLFCAENEMNDELVISYSDIIYNEGVLRKVIADKNDFVVTVDKNWYELWNIRMDNPLSDAETMKINTENNITELGKKPKSYDEIQGQYIGLIKISKNGIKLVKNLYHSLDKSHLYDGQPFKKMYMTSFIQLIINRVSSVKASIISGGWLEFDTKNDLEIYRKNKITI